MPAKIHLCAHDTMHPRSSFSFLPWTQCQRDQDNQMKQLLKYITALFDPIVMFHRTLIITGNNRATQSSFCSTHAIKSITLYADSFISVSVTWILTFLHLGLNVLGLGLILLLNVFVIHLDLNSNPYGFDLDLNSNLFVFGLILDSALTLTFSDSILT